MVMDLSMIIFQKGSPKKYLVTIIGLNSEERNENSLWYQGSSSSVTASLDSMAMGLSSLILVSIWNGDIV